VAIEPVRSKPDARGIDGAQAGENAVLFANESVTGEKDDEKAHFASRVYPE
jgi:hypothetical protein